LIPGISCSRGHAWSRHSALKRAAAVCIQPVGIGPGRHSGRLPLVVVYKGVTNYRVGQANCLTYSHITVKKLHY